MRIHLLARCMCLLFLTHTHEHTLGEQELQLWLCLSCGAPARRALLRAGQRCRILSLKDSPASLLMLGTRTRLSFAGRDEAGAATPPLGSVMEISELRAVVLSGGKHHAELSLCRADCVQQPKCWRVCNSWEVRGNAMWSWTCPS